MITKVAAVTCPHIKKNIYIYVKNSAPLSGEF